MQDNAYFRRDPSSGVWENSMSSNPTIQYQFGDGGPAFVDWSNPDIVYYRHDKLNKLEKSVDGGKNFSSNLSLSGIYCVAEDRQDPINPATIHSANSHIYQKNVNGITTITVTLPSDKSVTSLAVAPSNNNIIYITTFGGTWNNNVMEGKLLKSTNGGNNWTDLTATPALTASNSMNMFYWNSANVIVVDDKNPNKVWAGFNGFNDGTPSNRVCHSIDGGANWVSVSDGLPSGPVNTLIYQEGSDEVLFAGTDYGVYRYNKAINMWECFNGGLPMTIINDIDIDYCQKKIYASVFGRGVWAADLPDAPAEQITANTTIPTTAIKNAAEDIIVQAGVTLTVQGTINMAKGHKIVVQPNAKLIVDGGTLTNKCGDLWAGITVVGNSAQRQISTYQGKVILQNNATIEYAYDAITVGNYYAWGYDTQSGGGIVQATDAVFRNNTRDMAFMQYHNKATPSATVELPNTSYFTHCTFETTDDYRAIAGVSLNPHITMWDVYGVTLKGCTFQNTIPGTSTANVALHRKGTGIYTEGATYAIDWQCPSGDCANVATNIYPTFQGLERGIESIYLPSLTPVAASNHDITIRHCDFGSSNAADIPLTYAVKLTALNHEQVTDNNFWVGSTRDAAAPIPYGLYLDNCTSGFVIENNTFDSPHTNSSNPTVGLVVLNSATASNELYRNSFANLTVGTEPIGNNRAALAQADGLQLRCNTFAANETDVYVHTDPSGAAAQGIAVNQGADNNNSDPSIRSQALAGNLFSLQGGTASDFNNTIGVVKYHYHTTTLSPAEVEPTSTNGISKIMAFNTPFVASEACPDHQTVLPCPVPTACRTANWLIRTDALTQIALHQGILRNLQDGGNTPLLVTEIDMATVQNAYTLYAELLAKSPYLSEESLARLAAQTNFPDAMLRDIMVANSHAKRRPCRASTY